MKIPSTRFIKSWLFLFFLTSLLSGQMAFSQSAAMKAVDSLRAVGDYSGAIEHLEAMIPKTTAVYLKLAEIQQVTGNLPEALLNFERVLTEEPEKTLSSVAYGQLLMKAGKLEKADSIFSDLVQRFPKNPGFQYQMGIIKEKREEDTLAMKFFFQTLSLNPVHQAALYKVAKHLLSNKKYTDVKKLCERGLAINPYNSSLLSLLGQASFNQKNYTEAIVPFQKLVELGHGSEFIHTKLGYCHYNLYSYEKAIEEFQQALEYEDQNPGTHHNLGKLFALIGNDEKSEQHLLIALILKKQPVDAEFLSLALTYKQAGQFAQAMDAITNALEENPKNERAWYERANVADHFYEDLDTKLDFYEIYVSKFKESGNQILVQLAERRIQDLKEEIHMSK